MSQQNRPRDSLLPLPEGAQAKDRYDDEADASDDARGRRPDEGIRHSD